MIKPKLLVQPNIGEGPKDEPEHYRDEEPKFTYVGPDWAKTAEEAQRIRAADAAKTS
jgi:hypothetical protein